MYTRSDVQLMSPARKQAEIEELQADLKFYQNWDHDGSHSAEGERLDCLVRIQQELHVFEL